MVLFGVVEQGSGKAEYSFAKVMYGSVAFCLATVWHCMVSWSKAVVKPCKV